MTLDKLAETLSQLVGGAKGAGLANETITAELVAMAEAMRECLAE
jgi:hypothetical protein